MTSAEARQRRLLRTLLEHGVDFVLIGAHAVGAHGFVRATKDIDMVPAPDGENLGRLLGALEALDARMEPLDIPEHEEELSVEWLAQGGNFIFETSHGRLDVMQYVAGPDLTYEGIAADAEKIDLGGISVRVCSYERLVEMKKAADREQDRLDLRRLREARGEDH